MLVVRSHLKYSQAKEANGRTDQTESPLVRCSEAGNKGDSLGVACYRKLRTEWRLRGSKAKVKGKVGEMLRGPGGVSGCCGKAGQLVEGSWQRGPSDEES